MTLLLSLLLFWDSIKLLLNEFYIYPLRENVTEPTVTRTTGILDAIAPLNAESADILAVIRGML
ncbi:MAG: hypothetical protein ACYTXC_18265 [Nostoc sp.]